MPAARACARSRRPHPRRMGEEDDPQRRLRRGRSRDRAATPRRKLRLATPRLFGRRLEKKESSVGRNEDAEHEDRPQPGAGPRQAPAGQQRREGRRRRQAAPEVVDHFPAPDGRDRGGRARPPARPGAGRGSREAAASRPGPSGAGARPPPRSGREALEELRCPRRSRPGRRGLRRDRGRAACSRGHGRPAPARTRPLRRFPCP